MLTKEEAEQDFMLPSGKLRVYKGKDTNHLAYDGFAWWVRSRSLEPEVWYSCHGISDGLEVVGEVEPKMLDRSSEVTRLETEEVIKRLIMANADRIDSLKQKIANQPWFALPYVYLISVSILFMIFIMFFTLWDKN